MRICRACKKLLPITYFWISRGCPDDRSLYCKTCASIHRGRRPRRIRRTPEEDIEWKQSKSRRWYANHQKYWLNRRRNNPSIRLAMCMRTRINLALKRCLNGSSKKSAETRTLLGCSFEQLRGYLQSKFRDGMTWENYGPTWHVDHIKPCAAFDLTKPEEQAACFHYTNLQPLFKLDNLRKNRFYEDKSINSQ